MASFKDFTKNFPKNLQKAIDEVTDKRNMDELGESLVKDIKKRTKVGVGADKPGGSSKKLKKLADSTKKSRRAKKSKGLLSGSTTPAKSNLIETGDMVDSIHHAAKDGLITIDVDNDQVDKVEYNADNGREFLYLGKGQVKAVEKDLEKQLIAELKKLLK